MSDITKILLTSIPTLIIGVLIYVLGKLGEKLIIDPLIEYKKTVGLVVYNLIFYANIYSYPSVSTQEEKNEVSKTLRELASELYSRTNAISFPKLSRKIGSIPNRNNSLNGCGSLIGLSNALFNNNIDEIIDKRDKIKKYLNIKT